MTYELAKQLKEAGFSQRMGCSACLHGFTWKEEEDIDDLIRKGTWVHTPDLLELIEACGEGFAALEHCRENGEYFWKASQWWKPGEPCKYQSGNTPEEAVANLWLALNKK